MSKKHKKETTPLFPDQLFVTLQRDSDDDPPFLTAEETIDSYDDSVLVGVYELVSKRHVVVTRSLVDAGDDD